MNNKVYVGQPGLMLLGGACHLLGEAYGPCFLTGACLVRRDYRHVDVRMIVADEVFRELFENAYPEACRSVRWNVFCAAMTMYLARLSGLPVDFQVQSTSWSQAGFGDQRRVAIGDLL